MIMDARGEGDNERKAVKSGDGVGWMVILVCWRSIATL